jgi:hypothetical protein
MEGFLLIARRVSNNDNVGNFTSIPSSAQSTCDGTGVTHVDKTKLNSTSFIWTPAAAGAGDVYFIATVVRGWSGGFWTGLRSATVAASGSALQTSTASALQTSTASALTSTPTSTSGSPATVPASASTLAPAATMFLVTALSFVLTTFFV